jgi:hypothetical protein
MQDKLDPQEKMEEETFEKYCRKDLYATRSVLKKLVATITERDTLYNEIKVNPEFPDKVGLDNLLSQYEEQLFVRFDREGMRVIYRNSRYDSSVLRCWVR